MALLGGVQGYVTNKSGVPIIGAVVSCVSNSSPPKTNQQTRIASSNGYYSFVFQTPDTISLQCSAQGCNIWNKTKISFTSGQAKLVNIKMG